MKQLMASDKDDVRFLDKTNAGVVAVQDSVTAGPGGVAVKGNVEGDIQITNKKIEVNADHGAVVNIYDVPPRVKQRDALPQPPRPPRGFVNRTNELKWLSQRITASEAILVYGMDGMGKSALLKQTANSDASRAMSHGVLFLEGVDEHGQALGAEDVTQRLFDKLFESDPPLKVNFDIAQTYLSNTQPLVVLNGLSLPAASLSRMGDLFPRGAVLIESNQLIEGDSADLIELGPLPRTEAIELLIAKAGMTLNDDVRPTLDAICALLADVPLAIVTAAHAIRENKVTLERAYEILASIQPPSADALRNGIERAYALAYSTLTELERQFLAAAALAPGISIDPHWLNRMMEDKTAAEQAQEHLQAMGLLTANSPRLRIAPGLRELARMGVDEISVKEQFVGYLKAMLETRSLDWNYCADELGNILGMMDWAAKHQRWSDVISLGRAIDPYLTLRGLWEAWRMMIEKVLQSAHQLNDRVNEAWALHQLGTHAMGIERSGEAIDFLRQALDLRNTLGDVVGMAYTQHNLDLLIPPASPNKDDHEPPDKPDGKSPTSNVNLSNFKLRLIILGTIAVFGLFQVGLYVKASFLPSATPTAKSTTTPTVTPSPSPTFTPTRTPTKTPTPTEIPTLIMIVVTTPSLACSPTITGLQNANCRIGPSTSYDPPYGTLLEGQTVDILGVNPEGSWFLVDHPQSFRYPCWVWNGPAVQVNNGDLSCVPAISPPPSFKLRDAASEDQSSQSVSISDPVPPYCSLYPILCSGIRIPILPPIPPAAIPN